MPRKLIKAPVDFKETKKLYIPYISSNKKKKGMEYVLKENRKRLIHFGDSSMEDYRQHKDPKRRKNYLSRSAGIRDKYGNLTKNNKNSANYYSRKWLW